MTLPVTQLPDDSLRTVDLTRVSGGRFEVTNARGGTLPVGRGDHPDDPDFTPVELFLAALAGCASVNVEELTGRRAEPVRFDVRAAGHKVRDDDGGHLVGLSVTFDLAFPDDEDGDRARAILPRVLAQTRDRICTVSRTVHLGEPVDYRLADEPD